MHLKSVLTTNRWNSNSSANSVHRRLMGWRRAAAIAMLIGPVLSHADEAPRQFDIRSQSLSRALILFSQQSDLPVAAPADLVAGRQAPDVVGMMEPAAAIRLLLRGSGLQVTKAEDGSLRITREGASDVSSTPVSGANRSADEPIEITEVIVTGSHIRGPNIAGVLPVFVRTREDLASIGAATTDQLIASLPQAGGQAFNSEQQGPNQARGDVASVNFRGLGSGNTLVLLNGRRMVLHPTTQQEDAVPVQIVNVNSIPVAAIDRLEVLRDGAGAIYGADATAGVLNHVIDLDYEGLEFGLRHGFSEGTELDETAFDVKSGWSFNEGATHASLFGSALLRSQMLATDRTYSASNNRSALVSPQYASSFNDTSAIAPWLRGRVATGVTNFGPTFTQFHLQPCSFTGSDAAIPRASGVCVDGGSATLDAALRADEAPLTAMTPESDRYSVMGALTHRFDSGVELFSELMYYDAHSAAVRGGSTDLTSAPLTIAAHNPFNPFGSGPGRLLGYTGPAQGVNVVGLRVFDAGHRRIEVDSNVYRGLAGLRGELGSWQWETAALYSGANVEDVEKNRVSNTALQAALNSADPATAYNPFNGGDLSAPSVGDATYNPASVTDPLRIDVTRDSTSTLALADFALSNSAAFGFLGADVGAAVGVEWRRETYEDDRDPRVDGTINFLAANGELTSDVMNTSPTPDSEGSRNVTSAYMELQVPLITEERGIPLVRRIDTQLAARYERFSDIDEDVLKPKLSMGWEVTRWLQLRGTYAEGFRAPNLEQVNATEIRRVEENLVDLYQCALAQGVATIAAINQSACGSAVRYNVEDVRRGGRDLDPEDSETTSFGVVLQPLTNLTLTADWWRVEQSGLVGVFTAIDHLNLDAVRRLELGSSNPDLERNAAGAPIRIFNEFLNLDTRTVRGVDVSLIYDLPGAAWGDYRVVLDVSRLAEFEQTPSLQSAELLAAGLPASAGGSLLEQNDNPRTRASASVSWRRERVGVSLFARYVGEVEDTSALNFPVDDWLIVSGSASYSFVGGLLDATTVRLGVNNFLDEDPPLADEPFGYLPSLHDNRGRYFFIQINKSLD
ncbi:MAG: TonB-dependent receptor [Steroidobacter sp.]